MKEKLQIGVLDWQRLYVAQGVRRHPWKLSLSLYGGSCTPFKCSGRMLKARVCNHRCSSNCISLSEEKGCICQTEICCD